MGKDLQYQCLGVVGGEMQYRVTVRYYRNCWDNSIGSQSSPAPGSVDLEVEGYPCGFSLDTNLLPDPSAIPPNGSEVSQLCSSQLAQSGCSWNGPGNPLYPGVQIYTFTGIISVPLSCDSIVFGTDQCCRNGSINNIVSPGIQDLSIRATANNSVDASTGQRYCNTSVAFTNQPVPYFCLGSNVTFNHGAVDADGDSLVYTLVNPLTGGTLPYSNLAFNTGYSVNNPISTNGPFQFDTRTGQMQFVPSAQEQCVLAIRVDEYRNGVLVGSTMRDIQLVILNCSISIPQLSGGISNIQNGIQIDSATLQVCPQTPLSFDISFIDPQNHNLTITSNITTNPPAIPGATISITGSGDSVTATIQWTPQWSDTGRTHNFNITATNDDCPTNGFVTKVFTILVLNGVTLDASAPEFCGSPVQLIASGGSNFTWTPSTGLNAVSDPSIYRPTASPVSPTMYYFSSDCGTDSVFVDVAPPFSYDAGPGGSICLNGRLPLNASVDNLYPPYHFQWQPSSGLFDPSSGLPNDTIPNPVASPSNTTTYICYITANNGCINYDSVLVTVVGAAYNIKASAQPDTICPGEPVNLSAIATPVRCGINTIPCSGHYVQAQIGTGTGSTPPVSPTQYPTVYGHYSNSVRHQFLYLKNELIAQLGQGGTIDSVAFYLSQVNAPNDTMKNFQIKMGCTSATELSDFQPGMKQVFTPKNVLLGNTTGWKVHKLDSLYDWDGTENLVVEVCFYNPPGPAALNNKMQMTTTTFNSVYYSIASYNICANYTGSITPQTSMNRPNIRLSACITDIAGLPAIWTPSAGVNAPVPVDSVNAIAYPQTPVRYDIDVINANGCHSSDYIYVYVDTTVSFAAFPADTFFCSPTPVNLSTVTTGNPLPGNSFNYEFLNLNSNTIVYTGGQNNFTATPNVSTDYLVTLTGGACALHDTVHVLVGNPISIALDTTNITCFGANDGSVLATASGGTSVFTYVWSPGSNINPITSLGPGTYTVVATDTNNCTAQSSWTVVEPPLLTISISGTTNVSCFGLNDGSAMAAVTGGTPSYNFNWSTIGNSPNPATGFSAGNQSVTVTDSHNCVATASFTISQPPQLNITLTSVTNVTCNGGNNGAIDITISGGTAPYSYVWNNTVSSEDLNGVTAGTYMVNVTDAKNCMVSTLATISEPPPILISFTHTDPLCTGDANGVAAVTANGGTPGYVYDWASVPGSNNTDTINGLTSGVYDVTVYDSNLCSIQGGVALTSPVSLDAELINIKQISCANDQNGSVEVRAGGGTPPVSFIWSNNSTSNVISNLAPATYTVTVEDANGCDTSLSVTFLAPPLISIDLLTVDSASCPGYEDGSIHISAIGGTPGTSTPYEYSLDGVNFQSSHVFTNLPAGVYRIRIRDGEGCLKDTTIIIQEPVKPVVTILPQDSSIGLGQSITLVSSVSSYTSADINFYSWSPLTGLNCGDCASVVTLPYTNTTYILTVNYLSDCIVSETVSVFVGDGEDFFVPNAFSPNGDGNNDVFNVYGSGLVKANMKIFNRWGEKIFDSANQWLGWDGTYKGVIQNPGVYTYIVKGTYLNGKEKERSGSLILIK